MKQDMDQTNRENVVSYFEKKRLFFRSMICIAILLLVNVLSAQEHLSVEDAIEQANKELWNKFIDKYGIINDFVGEIPTPEDCILGRPNAIGWWSPIENGPFFTGLYLIAASERAQRSENKKDRKKAKRLADGLLKCASVSDVPGFIARGVGTDGKCHYPMGSDDQTIPWYLGLYSYLKSDVPSTSHRKKVIDKLNVVSKALMANDWKLPCDGLFKGENRGNLKSGSYLTVSGYLFILRMMYQFTGEDLWIEQYHNALAEHAEQRSVKSANTRLETCAVGYRMDSLVFRRQDFDKSQLWIYLKNQAALAFLTEMEDDNSINKYYFAGIEKNANYAREVIDAFHEFDNNDTKKFGHKNWREGYPNWFPQKTQEDAGKLSGMGNKEVLGDRKGYERRYMTNPLAAAAIISFYGGSENCKIVNQVIKHYDYSKLNLSEFFFAEVAYYSLPKN